MRKPFRTRYRLMAAVLAGVSAVVVVIAVYLITVEAWYYWTKSPDRAEEFATREFLRACEELNLSPNSFEGPRRINGGTSAPSFAWSLRDHPEERKLL
jgi:hypothetical protein